MHEPTLKDVLNAIATLNVKVDAHRADTKADIAGTRTDVASLRSDVVGLRTDVDGLRSEVRKGFADLDKELTNHAGTHREIEADIEALKRRPARTAARAARRTR